MLVPQSDSLIALYKLLMTNLHLESRQKDPNLQKIMTTAIIDVQQERFLT